MKYFDKGFSLIELMIVIAIVGILASIAVPSYQGYLYKSKIAEIITLLESQKATLIESLDNTGSCPSQVTMAGITVTQGAAISAGSYSPNVQSVYYNKGTSTGCVVGVLPVAAFGGAWIRYYIKPSATTGGGYTTYCGFLDTSNLTTLPYMPSSCNLTTLGSLGAQ